MPLGGSHWVGRERTRLATRRPRVYEPWLASMVPNHRSYTRGGVLQGWQPRFLERPGRVHDHMFSITILTLCSLLCQIVGENNVITVIKDNSLQHFSTTSYKPIKTHDSVIQLARAGITTSSPTTRVNNVSHDTHLMWVAYIVQSRDIYSVYNRRRHVYT